MAYQFISMQHKLVGEEVEKARFIMGVKRAMDLVKGQPPDQGKILALQGFGGKLVQDIVDRVGLHDKHPVAILVEETLITCYVGNMMEAS